MPARSRLEQYDHLMGECTDQAIAELADCSTEAVRRRRLKIGKDRFALAESTPPALLKYQHLFGKRPVADIAKLAGVSAYFVIKRMKQLGKPTFKRSAITNFDHLQGTMCDQALADLAGCSKECARRRRLRLGISANRDTREKN
ncbi:MULTISPECIES: hypothetical protein [Pseudomonas]|uniref:hypothetical protein n=1 Tax=Pseudomonas TaxID=286 RepID=UPI000CEB6A7C|nr:MULTISPECIES: hypothetical protein [Pseudomonas]EKV0214917.1 hypothetical protein [Pseudomonas aeruginosa]AVH34838.1 hypothetical protein AL532_00250 [Pseudomonas monteilii]EKX5071998.1 hypothetical protein [Pseudomonas aeruginosa]EKX8762980.1 hypothetical protein [Pseudomonas aeruginosa]MEB3881580.1 hypothetical protein [Pseudomonas guariconensis]